MKKEVNNLKLKRQLKFLLYNQNPSNYSLSDITSKIIIKALAY
jgi:hypothetical protein